MSTGIRDAVASRIEPEDAPGPEREPMHELSAGRAREHDSSLLAGLRLRARQLSTETTVDLAIPGYNEVLWGRFAAVSLARVLNQSDSVNPIMPSWQTAADALAGACAGLYGRNAHGELEPLARDVDVRFDDDLVDMLALDPPERTARSVMVTALGGGELGESRITALFMAYQGWLLAGVDIARDVGERAVGESRAG